MARRKRRQWGNGNVRQRGTGWQIQWRENGRRRARGGFTSRDDAERVLARVLGDIAQGRTGLPPDVRTEPTINVLAEPWLEARERTHRAAGDDRSRWKKHIAPHFGHLRPSEIDAGRIRAFAQLKLGEKLSAGTVRILVTLLSSLFTELVEDGKAQTNPARNLPRATRRLIKPTYDPRTTPFIEKLDDVRRIFISLPEPLNIAYALGALGGLRTGEVFALKWEHVDLATRRIHVRESISGPLKDKESRMVPVLSSLLPTLTAWKLKSGGAGLVVPPLRCDGDHVHKETYSRELRRVLKMLGIERDGLGWYQATRHTFASQWVINGGSIEKLKELLGHYSVVITERYAHLRTDLFAERDLNTITLDLRAGAPDPVQIGVKSVSEAASATRKAV